MKIGTLISFHEFTGLVVSTKELQKCGDILVLWSNGTSNNIKAQSVGVLI